MPKAATLSPLPLTDQTQAALDWLKHNGSKKIRDEMGPKYGVHVEKAFGVSMANMKTLAKSLGKNHQLAAALWKTGWYEARMIASMVDEPSAVTSMQMDAWCKDFDNWGICDTVCFNLFDRTPHAWKKVVQWSKKPGEFQKRTAFALLWSLTVHDKLAEDVKFIDGLALIETAAGDERHFVKKAVNMALRAVGKRNIALNKAATASARRLAEFVDATPRWIGKDALRELTSPVLIKRLSSKKK
ncbi:MAG: DNA alkylation repair protein [Arenimonas sp.]